MAEVFSVCVLQIYLQSRFSGSICIEKTVVFKEDSDEAHLHITLHKLISPLFKHRGLVFYKFLGTFILISPNQLPGYILTAPLHSTPKQN